MAHTFQAGRFSRDDAAALNEIARRLGGQANLKPMPPLYVARQGFDGQPVLYLDTSAIAALTRDAATANLGDPCLIPMLDSYGTVIPGAVAGLAQRVKQADGTVLCKEFGYCDPACGVTSIIGGTSPPPPPPPVPPSPPPSTYDLFVSVTECLGLDPTQFSYGVEVVHGVSTSVLAVNESAPGSEYGGVWVTGIPWGTDATVTLTATGTVWWGRGTVGCGGGPTFGMGVTVTVDGSTCANMAVAFSVGDCGPVGVPTSLDQIAISKIAE